jgi:arsenate reductase (thioredoxin)
MKRVLFLCTGNSARSIMAEALLNDPDIGKGRFTGYSAGSHPAGYVHPLALETLAAHHLPVAGLRSKSWDEFAGADAPAFDLVLTVCDHAAAEVCPIWPGHPTTAHWGVPDPAAASGTEAQRRRAFLDAFLVLRRRIELLAGLPLDVLDGPALKARLDSIGRTMPDGP